MGVAGRDFLPRFRLFGVIAKARGVDLRLTLGEYRNKLRVDVREYTEQRVGDPDSAVPTERGINICVQNLPRFMALLQQAARQAREEGRLKAEDFAKVGLPDPAGTTPRRERSTRTEESQ